MADSKVERSEKDGLVVIIDDEANLMTLEWDDETHPQWNFLRDLGEEGVSELIMNFCKQTLFEHEVRSKIKQQSKEVASYMETLAEDVL